MNKIYTSIEYFKNEGVLAVIDGGQTNNPSAKAFVDAFYSVDADHIIVLPNDGNIILTAKQAANIFDPEKVHVIETKSMAEGYSAMAMVASGLGVSIMNSLLLTNCPFELVQKPLDPPQHLTFGVAVRSWEQASPAVRKFCAYARGMLTSDKYDSQS